MKPSHFKSKFIKKFRECSFCKAKTEPIYKEKSQIEKFLSDRGKIINRTRTGLCNKHQKQLTKEVKKARFLAILPFIIRG